MFHLAVPVAYENASIHCRQARIHCWHHPRSTVSTASIDVFHNDNEFSSWHTTTCFCGLGLKDNLKINCFTLCSGSSHGVTFPTIEEPASTIWAEARKRELQKIA
jgi:hypothetical protein